ncbi:MAG TPA: glycogen debranching N-terminal domain-containing protein [Fibrobacteria bacterium]|nr:glycogen debranching N-terminal domain-containing protein [Fibrobacteria bacterium]
MSVPATVSMLEGDTFVVSDGRGDIDASPTETQGLFQHDTRFLSRWVLTLDGKRLHPLSTDDIQYFSMQFFLVPGTGTIYVDSKLSVIRKRAVGRGFREEIEILNHDNRPVDLEVALSVGSDFADLFEVKDALAKKGELYQRTDEGVLVLGYRREKFVRETRIESDPPYSLGDGKIVFKAHIGPHGEWKAALNVIAVEGGAAARAIRPKYKSTEAEARPNVGGTLKDWLDRAPKILTSWQSLGRTYKRSLIDLAALRFFPGLAPGDAMPAAGLPWFMAMFGRDSILTSLQALPFAPELARTTLRVLGARQGTRIDDFRDEEPGKILHESRWGELTAFEERPHSPYFGSADVTPLFLVLLDEYVRWSGDAALAASLEDEARAALRWIDAYGDRDNDGYVEYDRRNAKTGLENQCWKDSSDSIAFADGRLAERPIATCEIQGYVYDAKIRSARLAREVWNDPAFAGKLEREAADLKIRFNADFWMPDRRCFALALDRRKNQVDSITSNIGHLLFSGIVDADKADDVVGHLLGDALYSGWGVRTMAVGEARYNPIGYHVGTIWPHDNSIIALGLMRYRRHAEASRIAYSILEAASYFNHRLPEAFAGYPRQETQFPVEYPTACSPQAWASGAPLLMLRVLLGLEPLGEHLVVEPVIPAEIAHVGLLGIPGRWGRADAFGRGRVDLGAPAQLELALV